MEDPENVREIPILYGWTATSRWQGGGQIVGVVAVAPTTTPRIGQCGNAYAGPCPHDIEARSDAAEYRLGLRVRATPEGIGRMTAWLARRSRYPYEDLARAEVMEALAAWRDEEVA